LHPFVLIPLASALGLAALAAAVAARDPASRPARATAALLACAAWWSTCQLLWCTAADASAALAAARWAGVGAFAIGPLALHAILALDPAPGGQPTRWLGAAWGASAACSLLALATPALVADVSRASWGFTPVASPALVPLLAAAATVPAAGGVRWLRRDRPHALDPARDAHIETAALAAGIACIVSELVLPLLGIQTPRILGPAVLGWGAVLLRETGRFRAPIFDPRSYAREILETLPVGLLMVRPDGRIRTVNGRMGEIAGRCADDLVGRNAAEILPVRLDAVRDGSEREVELECDDGCRIPVAISITPLCDASGEPLGRLIVVRDLRELAALRSGLVAAGRLAAVGQLAGGISHELNNPIAYTNSNLHLLERHGKALHDALRKESGDPLLERALEEVPELIGECLEGVDRVASVVRDVGGFSRSGSAAEEIADLRELLESAIRIATPHLRGRAEIEREYGEAPLVRCVPRQLVQVFLNLIVNASQAFDGSGTIRLEARSDGDQAGVRIEDDGRGISPEDLERIFDPFFTTRPPGEGTGLGLAISRQIVDRHGGRIEMHSAPGEGARCVIQLPAAPAPETGTRR
jgi:PAS domain S-box-containing protein